MIANLNQLTVTANKELFSRWNKPVDRMRWEMSAATVNAYYHPFKNIIVFPAAILQAPFYSLKQSSSQNYGGIGAVIAHEISHAFDNNGSLFDEFGNLNNWWTDEDSAHFKQLAQKMIEEFDGIPFAGQKVNGSSQFLKTLLMQEALVVHLKQQKLKQTSMPKNSLLTGQLFGE